MKRLVVSSAIAGLLFGGLTIRPLFGQAGPRYAVTVTNMTRGQSFTPILVVTHSPAVRLFVPGTAASPELRELAEEGNTGPFVTLLRSMSGQVGEAVTTNGLLTPGVTVGVELSGDEPFDRLSIAAMLIPTNDGFFGVTGVSLPRGNEPLTIDAPVYDSGTERNDERCASIPGPNFLECGGPGGGARVGGGEGAVTVHNGIHGIGDLRASERDWRNPAARIVIRRVQ